MGMLTIFNDCMVNFQVLSFQLYENWLHNGWPLNDISPVEMQIFINILHENENFFLEFSAAVPHPTNLQGRKKKKKKFNMRSTRKKYLQQTNHSLWNVCLSE